MRPLPHPAVAALALPLVLAACASSDESIDELTDEQRLGLYLENAIYYMEMGDIDRAQFQAEKALEIDPGNERFQLIYGRANLMRGNAASIEEAIRTFERIRNKDDYRVQMTWAAALERKGVLYDEAARGVRDGSRATDAADRDARANELAEEAVELWEEAHEHFRVANELRTGETEALNGLVRTSALLGRLEESLAWTRDLIESIRAAQGLVQAQLEDPDLTAEREAQLREAARANRGLEVKARLHAATLLRSLERRRDAVAEFERIHDLEPDLAQAHSLRAQLLFDLGEHIKARAALQRFLELTELTFDDPAVRRAYELQDRCDRAIRAANRSR